jgi:hypothetical protein
MSQNYRQGGMMMLSYNQYLCVVCFVFVNNASILSETLAASDEVGEAKQAIDESLGKTEQTIFAVLTSEKKSHPLPSRMHGDWSTTKEKVRSPEETKQLLAADQESIRSVCPDVVQYYQKIGIHDKEIARGIASAWYKLRVGPNAIPGKLSGEDFSKFIRKWCYTEVDSKPQGAVVRVGQAEFGITRSVKYLSEGKHRFTLEKDGFQPYVSEESVVPNKKNSFMFSLTPQEPKPGSSKKEP